jgi:hypothetical protein
LSSNRHAAFSRQNNPTTESLTPIAYHHAQKQTIHRTNRRPEARSLTYHSHTQHFTNASERILPRSRSRTHCCTRTSGQTWLTAARPETHQNLIHTSKEHSADKPAHNARDQKHRWATLNHPTLWGRSNAPIGKLLRGRHQSPSRIQGTP